MSIIILISVVSAFNLRGFQASLEFPSLHINKTQFEHVIFIDPTVPKQDISKCEEKKLKQDSALVQLCPDVNSAFKLQHRNSTVFIFASGSEVTHFLKADSASTFFSGVSDTALMSNSSGEVASVECQEGAGIVFLNSNRITIVDISFSYCGALRDSISKNFTAANFTFLVFRVSLFFCNCSNMSLQHVAVQHSVSALGIGIYNTDGIVNVFNSNFSNNTIDPNSNFPGGGGFAIEFTYCVPGRIPCQVQSDHNTNSTYTFVGCRFSDNLARAHGSYLLLPFNETHESVGRGGGVSAFFRGNAIGNRITFVECDFVSNKAHWGGGMFLDFGDTAISNDVVVDDSRFINNECHNDIKYGTGGGGIKIISELNFDHVTIGNDSKKYPVSYPFIKGNTVNVKGTFERNRALNGGGILYVSGHQINSLIHQTTLVVISDCIFRDNLARIGAALDIQLFPLFVEGISSSVQVTNTSFLNNSIEYYDSHANNYSIGLGIVYSRKISMSFSGNLDFIDNVGSALSLVGTHACFSSANVSFINNTGSIGAGIALLGTSFLVIDDYTNLLFDGNQAEWAGSAIFNQLVSKGVLESSIDCFIRHSNPYLSSTQWKATFTFRRNREASIFASSVYGCAISNKIFGANITQNLLFCQGDKWIFEDSSCLNEINTQGDKYTLENVSTILAFPGKEFALPIRVFDDLSHDITSQTGYSSYLASGDSQVAQVDPNFALTSGNLSIMGQEKVQVVVKLQSSGSRPHFIELPVYLQTCPPGFYLHLDHNDSKNGKCLCHSQYNYRGKLNCSDDDFVAQIPWNYWIGVDPSLRNDSRLVMGELANLYGEQFKSESNFVTLPKSLEEVDDVICGRIHRTGTMCGKCQNGYGVAVNSYYYECTTCNSNSVVKNAFLYIVSTYLPYTLLFMAIVLFRLKLTSSAVSGFLLYAQMTASIDLFDLSIHVSSKFSNQAVGRAYKFIHGIFNMGSFASFVKPFCLSNSFNTLDVLCLEYLIALLPLVIICAIYLGVKLKELQCCKFRKRYISFKLLKLSNHKRNKTDRKTAIIHAFAAFLLLSYAKISLVSMKILASTTLFDDTGRNAAYNRVYLAGYLSLSSRAFILPYGLIATVFVTLFVITPTLFLLGFPQLVDWLLDKPRFKCFRRFWPSLKIHAVLDTFQGYYRHKCWCFSGVYLLFRLSVILSYCATNSYTQQYFLQQFFIMVMLTLVAVVRPYKRMIFNIVDTLIFLDLGIINSISAYFYSSSLALPGMDSSLSAALYVLQNILLWLPMTYMISYGLYKVAVRTGLCSYIKKKRNVHQRATFHGMLDSGNNGANVERSDSDDLDADSALFHRASSENCYLPPARNEANSPSSTLVSVLRESVSTSNINTESSGFQTGSNTG